MNIEPSNGSKPKVFAILLAAGSSQRFGSDKLSHKFQSIPVWLQSFRALISSPEIDAVGIVTSPESIDEYRKLAPEANFIIAGGSSRQESSRLGTKAVPEDFEIVIIHDAARPFVSHLTIFNVVHGVKMYGAAFPALPATDTFRYIQNNISTTLNRPQLYAAQTPQGAYRQQLLKAHQAAVDSNIEFTDDIAILENIQITGTPVPGDPENIKITFQSDVGNLSSKSEIRTGLGYDIHAFSTDPNRPLWLGGVEFPNDRPGLDGHSDADSLLHAVVDALLGAISAGDIGLLYPNTDPHWHNCPSIHFLEETSALLHQKGWNIVNIDATVIAERPKIMVRKDEIIGAIASAAGLDPSQVSVKATTNEKLGAIGKEQGIAAFAIATVTRQLE